MRRRIVNLLTVLALMLCVAVCLLWVRTAFVFDQIIVRTPARSIVLGFRRTGPTASVVNYNKPDSMWGLERDGPHRPQGLNIRNPTPLNRAGFFYARRRVGRYSDLGLAVPWWLLAAMFAVPPTLNIARRHRRRRGLVGGLCAACGYDLRATPGRCPECGTPQHAGAEA